MFFALQNHDDKMAALLEGKTLNEGRACPPTAGGPTQRFMAASGPRRSRPAINLKRAGKGGTSNHLGPAGRDGALSRDP